MQKFFFVFLFSNLLSANQLYAQQTLIQYLSGRDSDHPVNWEFYCTGGKDSGKWTSIPVPSCWELQGFGNYNYGREKPELHSNEKGYYRYRFQVKPEWKGRQINIVFEGSMTDTKVKINGKIAGKIHQGAFYQFKYDITPLLFFNHTNELEVEVAKQSANESVNRAERQGDFWIFGGIFRPVYLEALPKTYIERTAISALADGQFRMEVFLKNAESNSIIEAEIEKAGKTQKLKAISVPVKKGEAVIVLNQQYKDVDLWSPEFPNLYRVKISLKNEKRKVVHIVNEKFGFRTAALRPGDGFYLNGEKVKFKGVNHHSFWPETGRSTSKAISLLDVALMKDMNMNAVRMSHYPPDIHFLNACDSLGLIVIDELTGWQAHYDDTTGHRLVKEMVIRDVNHPSIVMWANGNEGGFNRNLDGDYALYDPQKRLVIHPWEKFNGTNTKHYPDYNFLENLALYSNTVFFPTEFLHGLYDGGAGAGLNDYWKTMQNAPLSAGGFLWVFADEGIVRKDLEDSIDTHRNYGPDGIVGPHREKEASYFAIKEIWSPVIIEPVMMNTNFNGKLAVENRYLFTNLNQCTFQWKLISFDKDNFKSRVQDSGKVFVPSIQPGEKKWIDLQLPSGWPSVDVLYLTAFDPHHREIFTWSWPIRNPAETVVKFSKPSSEQDIRLADAQDELIITGSDLKFHFNKKTGYLQKVERGDTVLSLSGGPVLAGLEQQMETFNWKTEGKIVIVEAAYKGKDNWLKVKWTFEPERPARLNYSFQQSGEADYIGITFQYPEQKVKGMQWIGRGPYPVWKNRLKGLLFGIWEKAYNNTIPGESWNYPPFKGNYAEVYRVNVKTTEIPFTVFTESKNLFFQMLKPSDPKGASNDNTTVKYPGGNIGFLHAIQAIGTKFHPARKLGPQSQPNIAQNAPYEGTLWFDFR